MWRGGHTDGVKHRASPQRSAACELLPNDKVAAPTWVRATTVHAKVIRRSWTGLNTWELNTRINVHKKWGTELFEKDRRTCFSAAPRVRVQPQVLHSILKAARDVGTGEVENESAEMWTVLNSQQWAHKRPRSIAAISDGELNRKATVSVCTFRAPCLEGMAADAFAAALLRWKQKLTDQGACEAILEFNEEEGEYAAWGVRGLASQHMYKHAATHVFHEEHLGGSTTHVLLEATAEDKEQVLARGEGGGGLVAWVHENCDLCLEEFSQASEIPESQTE